MSESVQTEQPQQEDTLSQKRNVLRVVTEKQLITPGQSQQLIIKSDMDGTILGVVLGPNAKGLKLFAGKAAVDVPEDVTAWRPNIPIKVGNYVVLVVENTGDEPAIFSAMYLIDAPNHKVVVGTPQAPPPFAPETVADAPPQASLTAVMPPQSKTTLADLGVKPGANEIGIVMLRNDATFLLDHLRNNTPLTPNVKFGLIRRLDDVLKAKK